MHYPINLFFLVFLLLLSCTPSSAFNITQILTQHPDLRTYNDFLTQTQLADLINDLETATILVVDTTAMSAISNRPIDVIRTVLSLHVVLDYYDVQKLQHLPNNTATLTTLFQTSGQASGLQGFLNATSVGTGGVSISWAAGSGVGANLVKAVVSQPYNLSVVQISTLILPSTIINNSTLPGSPPPSVPTPPPQPAPVPSPPPRPHPPSPSPAPASPPRPWPLPPQPRPMPHPPLPAPMASPPSPPDSGSPSGSGQPILSPPEWAKPPRRAGAPSPIAHENNPPPADHKDPKSGATPGLIGSVNVGCSVLIFILFLSDFLCLI